MPTTDPPEPVALHQRTRAGAAALTMLVVLTSGCASLERAEPPEVTLVDLAVTDITVFETTLEATLRISNPNPDPLEVEGASFALILDGRKVGRGASSEVATVPRLGSTTVSAIFHLSNLSAIERVRKMVASEVVDYGLRGKLYVRRSWGRSALRSSTEGRINLAGGPGRVAEPEPSPDP